MGRVFERYIDAPRVHVCAKCTAHLANDDEIISRSFQGDLGRAFLFEKAVNITRGPTHDRVLMTGMHSVANIFCVGCQDRVGWIYVSTPPTNPTQRYKIGKVLLESVKIEQQHETDPASS